MNFIEYMLLKFPQLRDAYDQEIRSSIEYGIQEEQSKIPDHEWWRLDEIHIDETSITLAEKYRIFTDIFMDMIKDYFKALHMLQDIFDIIEVYLQLPLSEEEHAQIEVFFLESVINSLEWKKKDGIVYELLGSETKKMWDKNRALWNSTNARNIGDLIRT